MSAQDTAEHFDLARFVLGYLEREGSLAAAPAFGVYEVLLPDALAAALRVEPYLNLAFEAGDEANVVRVSVNHPLVETIAERLLEQAGHTQVAINHVRLEKRGLFDLAAKAWTFPNARLTPLRDAFEQASLHHYLRFNFRATFLSDEKQEQIISAVFDVQNGCAVRSREHLERLASSETETAFSRLPVAPPRWSGAGDALAPITWQALLARAGREAETLLADRLAGLQTRSQRFLELDRARLQDYYDSLDLDLKQRLARAEGDERRAGIESKIEVLQAERSAKLADTLARHQIRVELELINLLLIVQPKIVLPVAIVNRRATINRLAVWDPLMHSLEPLVCDHCGQPGLELHLCTNGRLSHEQCLAPRCIECNRVYCLECAEQMTVCVVCAQPVCRASLRVCSTCGRGACAEHQTLCHADAGQPATLKKTPPPPVVTAPPPPPQPTPPKASARPPSPGSVGQKGPAAKPTPAAVPAAPALKAVAINLEIYEDTPRIVAFVMRSQFASDLSFLCVLCALCG